MVTSLQHDLAAVRRVAEGVPDPEIPAVTVGDLGILRNVRMGDDGVPVVGLTPTYSGCPAVLAIEIAVREALIAAGMVAHVERVLSPPWTSDWITAEGREKLRAYGIAPPVGGAADGLFVSRAVPCPRCSAMETELISQFGSTACKSLWRCRARPAVR